ncbi:MAG: hypothetical protein WD673_07595 [Alphaproteobacteria bacterium]
MAVRRLILALVLVAVGVLAVAAQAETTARRAALQDALLQGDPFAALCL